MEHLLRASLPVFLARYANNFSWWKAMPLNDIAKESLPHSKTLTEVEWVQFLYRIRGYELPESVILDLKIEV